MPEINPGNFADAFLAAFQELQVDFDQHWNDQLKPYTEFIRGKFLPRIAQLLNVQSYTRDYYGLDSIFYSETDGRFPKGTTYARHLEVAIEHENIASGSRVEIHKLQHFNARLKVLIIYTTAKETERLLPEFSDIIRAADFLHDIATKRKQLVICGKAYREGSPPMVATDWRFYVYTDAGLTPMVLK